MALAGHVSRAHKSKSRKKEETKEEEETNSKQETDLTDSAQSQLVTPIPPSQNTTAMQPPQQQPVVAQSQPIPPSPQDFFNPYRQRPMYPAYYQQQPPPNTTAVQQPQQPPQQQPQQEQQNTKKYDPIEILFGLLSTPTVAEAVKMYLAKNSSSNEGEDPIKQLAFQQMIEAWKEEHERARKAFETQEEMLKQMMAAFSLNSTKSYAKGLEEYYKGIGKVRAQKDSQKLLQEEEEEIQQPPADPLLQVLLEMNQKLQKLDKLDKLDKLTKKKKKNPQQTTQPQNTYTPPPTSSDDGVFVS